jgi:hypothetical protein
MTVNMLAYSTCQESIRDDVRNNEGGPAIAQSLETFLNQLLGLGVDSAGSFIQKNDFRLLQDSTGNGNTLLLTTGQLTSNMLAKQ